MNFWHHNWLAMTIIAGLMFVGWLAFQVVAMFPALLQWIGWW